MNKTLKSIVLLSLFVFISCSKSEVVILIEQPFSKELDKKNITININDNNIYNGVLDSTNIASKYKEVIFNVDSDGEHLININLNGNVFNFNFSYPEEKYIILSPSFDRGKVNIGILKQKDKFNLH